MPIIPQGYGQVNYRMTLAGDPEPMMVTIGVKFDSVITDPYTDIVNDIDFVFFDKFKNHVCAVYTFQGATLYASVEGGNAVYESDVGPRAFLNAATALPQNCAYLIKKITGAGGRTGRGRMYIPGVSETNATETGALAGGVQAAIQTSAAAFLTALNAVPGIDSAVLLHSLVGDIPNPITALATDSRIATQRRRLR